MNDPMLKVTTSSATKLFIEGADSLDPITVFLEDFEPRRGKITVSCWGKSWTAYWGGMWDGLTVGQFFTKLNASYIIGYFDSQLSSTQFSAENLVKLVEGEILKRRREGDISEEDARDWFDDAGDLAEAPSIDWLHGGHSELMTNVLGDEWWYRLDGATEPNSDYEYLCRIIAAVQQTLKQREVAHDNQ